MTIFDPSSAVDLPETIDLNKKYYEELVGTGKKFIDNEALARAKAESDLFITRLQKEGKEIRDELARSAAELKMKASLEELLNKVTQAQAQPPRSNVQDEPATQPAGMTEEQIANIVNQRLTAKDIADKQNQNVSNVRESLKKALGPNYTAILEQKTAELGLDKDFLDNLAKTAPKAFFSVLGISPNQEHSIFSAPESTVSPPRDNHGTLKNYAYYKDLKSKMRPEEYYSPKIQNEMFVSRQKLGDAF